MTMQEMKLRLDSVNEKNFWDIINLKSDEDQEKRIQIFERWVGSNTFFLASCHVYGFTPKAIYDDQQLIGFTSYGFREEFQRYELISIMLGHQYQERGYGVPVLKLIIEEMKRSFSCTEIYLSVIHDNFRAIKAYEKLGFTPTGEVEQGHHPEPIYCLKLT